LTVGGFTHKWQKPHGAYEGGTMSVKKAVAALLVAGATTTGMAFLPNAAFADKFKDCGTTVVEPGPGQSGFTQTETETQIAQCESASDSGEVTTTGPVTNRGGGTPGGQQ
jgi:hypothetical protein